MAKGKVVKRLTISVPGPDGEWLRSPEKVPISLTVGDGLFHMPLPEYVTAFLGQSPDFKGLVSTGTQVGYSQRDKEVYAKTIDGVEGTYNVVANLYRSRMRDQLRRKVIVVSFNATHGDTRRMNDILVGSKLDHLIRPAHMNGPGPSLTLRHEIMWHIGEGLYRVYERADGEPPQMTYMRAYPKDGDHGARETFVLDWTEEREDFFVRMREAMNTLIERITVMLGGDLTATVDRLIASGSGLLALPAPPQEQE